MTAPLLDQGAAAIAAAVRDRRATPRDLLGASLARVSQTHEGAQGLNALLARPTATDAPEAANG